MPPSYEKTHPLLGGLISKRPRAGPSLAIRWAIARLFFERGNLAILEHNKERTV
jgi:hypothetical protein